MTLDLNATYKTSTHLGRGAHKECWALKDYPDLALLTHAYSHDKNYLEREIAEIEVLTERKIPAIKVHGIVQFVNEHGHKEGEGWGMVVDKYDFHAKAANMFEPLKYIDFLDGLEAIYNALEQSNTSINDLQFLFRVKDRSVVVADPLGIRNRRGGWWTEQLESVINTVRYEKLRRCPELQKFIAEHIDF